MNATRTRKSGGDTKSTRGRKNAQGRAGKQAAKSRGTAAKKTSRTSTRGGSSSGRGATSTKSATRGRSSAGTAARGNARNASSTGSRTSRSGGGSRTPIGQAIGILMADHKMVQQMFRQGERAKENPDRLREIVEAACAALTLHTEIEEQHLYPVMRATGKDTDMIAEAYVEHASAKQLIAELEGGDPEDEAYAAKFKVLGEYVKHHVKEEENEIFPKARRARGDFAPLLEALVARDEAVMAEGSKEGQRSGRDGSGRSRRDTQSAGADTASAAAGGLRGRQGRGRGSSESPGASTGGLGDEGEERAGGDETMTDIEQPHRGRRGGQDATTDAETGSRGRDSESEEQDSGSTRQGR